MASPRRISPGAAHEKVQSGEALLVCAYDDEEKCKQNALEGSRPLTQIRSELSESDRDRDLVFYCA